jgi:hypothetical protein
MLPANLGIIYIIYIYPNLDPNKKVVKKPWSHFLVHPRPDPVPQRASFQAKGSRMLPLAWKPSTDPLERRWNPLVNSHMTMENHHV